MLQGFERRGFMKVMAASFGLAGLGMTGCRRPEQAIMPYGKSPEELIPGVPNFYATSFPSPHGNLPLIVESHSGRPTKIEGNPSYLPFGGSTDIYAQASVLDLYDPDRARGSFRKIENKDGNFAWSSVDTKSLISEIATWTGDGKLAILADHSFSLVRSKLTEELKAKGIEWFEHEAIDLRQPEKLLANGLGLESGGLRALPDLARAKRAISLDCDFLGSREPYALANTRSFMAGRKVSKPSDAKKMNRLYSVEADMTLTGGIADHRRRIDPSQLPAFAFLLAAEILSVRQGDEALVNRLKELGKSAEVHRDWIEPCVEDLWRRAHKFGRLGWQPSSRRGSGRSLPHQPSTWLHRQHNPLPANRCFSRWNLRPYIQNQGQRDRSPRDHGRKSSLSCRFLCQLGRHSKESQKCSPHWILHRRIIRVFRSPHWSIALFGELGFG